MAALSVPKTSLSNDITMAYFDPQKNPEFIVDVILIWYSYVDIISQSWPTTNLCDPSSPVFHTNHQLILNSGSFGSKDIITHWCIILVKADYYSGHPCTWASSIHIAIELVKDHIFLLISHATPKAMTLKRLQEATESNPFLQLVITTVQNGQWNVFLQMPGNFIPDTQTISKSYFIFAIQQTLTVTNTNLPLWEARIVKPIVSWPYLWLMKETKEW